MLWSDGLESWKACDEPIKKVGLGARSRRAVLRLRSGMSALASPVLCNDLMSCTLGAHFLPFCSCPLDCSSCNFV